VVTAIGGRSVSTPDRFRRILGSYGPDEDIQFDVVRDGGRASVTGRLRS
jgi:S1-C subfamily serine protease